MLTLVRAASEQQASMANMATRVQRAWSSLLALDLVPASVSVALLRGWIETDLMQVSRKLPVLVNSMREQPAWRRVLSAPVESLAIRRSAWDEWVGALGERPPSFDPHALIEWAKRSVWSLAVFRHPEESCGHDQFELELWWSEAVGRPALVCGLGHHFSVGRADAPGGGYEHLPWSWRTEDLLPAARAVAQELFPDEELLP